RRGPPAAGFRRPDRIRSGAADFRSAHTGTHREGDRILRNRPRMRGLFLRAALGAALALIGVYTVSGNAAAAPPTGFSDTVVANVTLPVGLAFTPDGRMLVTTKPGDLYACSTAGAQTLALDGTGFICAKQPGQDERGMLGVAV